MAVWRVSAECIDYLYVDIEADTAEQALEYADCLDADSFKSNDGEWIMTKDMVCECEEGSVAMFNANEKED